MAWRLTTTTKAENIVCYRISILVALNVFPSASHRASCGGLDSECVPMLTAMGNVCSEIGLFIHLAGCFCCWYVNSGDGGSGWRRQRAFEIQIQSGVSYFPVLGAVALVRVRTYFGASYSVLVSVCAPDSEVGWLFCAVA